tara:strand:+ start:1002 stop:1262 length:261 start_codon:yes stop_codon:yes gene_type:complete
MKGYIMDNTSKIALTPAQEAFVKMANEEGFTTEITRKDIISLQSKHGITKPAWLMKNQSFRLARGGYSLPTLGQTVEANTTESDSE